MPCVLISVNKLDRLTQNDGHSSFWTITPRNGHEKSSLIDPIQQIPDDIRSDRTSRVMISMVGMIHLIRLDNPQYYLRKFCDVNVRPIAAPKYEICQRESVSDYETGPRDKCNGYVTSMVVPSWQGLIVVVQKIEWEEKSARVLQDGWL
jgi:hypothetical protein